MNWDVVAYFFHDFGRWESLGSFFWSQSWPKYGSNIDFAKRHKCFFPVYLHQQFGGSIKIFEFGSSLVQNRRRKSVATWWSTARQVNRYKNGSKVSWKKSRQRVETDTFSMLVQVMGKVQMNPRYQLIAKWLVDINAYGVLCKLAFFFGYEVDHSWCSICILVVVGVFEISWCKTQSFAPYQMMIGDEDEPKCGFTTK